MRPDEGGAMECRHEACVCNVTEGEYCSEQCRQNAGTGSDTCNCGHPDCELHQEKKRVSPGIND